MSDLNELLERLERQMYEDESDAYLLEDAASKLRKLQAENEALKDKFDSLYQEIELTLVNRGYWTPPEQNSADLIMATGQALEKLQGMSDE